LVTSEYVVYFKEPISEFSMFVLTAACDGSIISKNLKSVMVETDMTEREFLAMLAEYVEVENIGYIKAIRTLEPDWSLLENT